MSEESTVTTDEVVETTETTTEASTEKAFVDSMLDSMTDAEIKDHKMWDNLKGKSADELGRYVKELKSFTGKKGDIPKEDASEEEWGEFYAKMGRPESADAYEWNLNDEFKELVGDQAEFYEGITNAFKEKAFEVGLSDANAEKVFNAVIADIGDKFGEVNTVRTEREAAAEAALNNEWKESRQGIEQGIKAVLKDKGGLDNDAVDSLIEAGLFKEPKLAIALGRIASQFDDDSEIGGLHTRTQSGLEDQKMDLESQMLSEKRKFGQIQPNTKRKWMEINARI